MVARKKIELKNYTKPNRAAVLTKDKKYNVVLFWGHKKYFTNKKEVLNYLAESSRLLNNQFNELNFLLADCFRAYRLAWPYIESKTANDWFNNQFANVARQMDRFLNNFGIQGNFNAFDKFHKATEQLGEILNKLEIIEKERLKVWPAEIKAQKTRLINCRVVVDQFLKD
jgi:hypothetical protein